MKYLFSVLLLVLFISAHQAQDNAPEELLWEINRLDSIGGYPVSLIGNPQLIDTEEGQAVEFDGVDDGLIIPANPLAGATEFTIEVIFNPYAGGLEEQRFLHIEQDSDNRALIELRSTPEENWFLDTFIKSGSSSRALLAENFEHESEEWWHACLVYKDGMMTHYVNGEEEMSGAVNFQEVSTGNTSLGVRQNLVSWYKGAIQTVKVSHRALMPEEFLIHANSGSPSLTTEVPQDDDLQASIYPNPVAEYAYINFTLLKRAEVVLEICNIHSGQIYLLVDDDLSAGKHAHAISNSELPAGLYYYRLSVGNLEKIEKFAVIE